MAEKMKNNNPRGSTDLHGTLARAVRLLEYLRKNTDKNHPITQTALLRAGDDNDKHIFGAKKTLVKTIAALANAMNTDKDDKLKPKEDWRLCYKGFDEYYDDCDDDNDDKMLNNVTNIYFNHIFTDDELTAIINALYSSKAVARTQAEIITGKLVKNLAKKNYKPPAYVLDFSEPTDSLPGEDPARLSKTITVIQTAISEGLRILFDYNRIYSNTKGDLKPYGNPVRNVSPHYIVCENGRLFLYGGFENGKLCVHRVDMITNIDFEYEGNGKGKSKITIPSMDKFNIGLPPEKMTEEFKVRHLYSSYKKDDWITVEFVWSCRDEKNGKLICTALYGAFGNRFKIDGSGKVTVQTSRFGMKIFALQYADYVKVIRPSDLVNEIAKSVRGLRDKYL